MNFLKNLLNKKSPKERKAFKQEVILSLDDLFVHNFIAKGGKFLYCSKEEEVTTHLISILAENNWDQLQIQDPFLYRFTSEKIRATESDTKLPIFTTCEHLIADNGDILFSSNQLKSKKIADFTEDFIVCAKTSQIVKDNGEALTGIKTRCKDNLPTNISAIRNYTIKINDDNFLNYGNSNSKNLYLLLFEDL